MQTFLDIPKVCDNCKSPDIHFVANVFIYGKSIGHWPYVWHCSSCNACVGCRDGTQIPLGLMANKAVRKLRSELFKVFNEIWISKYMSKHKAYNWLATSLRLQDYECNIATMPEPKLKQGIVVCTNYILLQQSKKAK